MGKVEIKLNSEGVRSLLRSDEICEMCENYAEQLAKAADGKYIIIEKTGSSTQDFITTASIVIKSYADSKYEVAQLNEKIKDVMLYQFIENDDISSVKLVTDYPYPDTAIKKERYQALFEIVY